MEQKDMQGVVNKYRGSWVELAEKLVEVRDSELFREWCYDTFNEFAKNFVGLSPTTIKEMMMAYSVLQNKKPEVLQDEDAFVPNYHDICVFEKAVEADSNFDNMRDQFMDNIGSGKLVLSNIKETIKSDVSDVMEDIAKATKRVKKTAKKLRDQIEMTSSFGTDIVQEANDLYEKIERVE